MKRQPLLVPAIIIGVYLLFSDGPMVWLVLSSFKRRQDLFTWPPSVIFQPVLTGYQAVFGLGAASKTAIAVGLYASLVNSIVVSVLGTLIAVTLGTLAGYAASRFQFPGRGDFMFFVLSTRMIPPVAVLVFYHVMYSRLGLSDTRVGLVLVTTFINLGLATWIMKGFFDGVPTEVENIALVNGIRACMPSGGWCCRWFVVGWRPRPVFVSSLRGTSSRSPPSWRPPTQRRCQ